MADMKMENFEFQKPKQFEPTPSLTKCNNDIVIIIDICSWFTINIQFRVQI